MAQNENGQMAAEKNAQKQETKVYTFYVYGCMDYWSPLLQKKLPAGGFFDTAHQLSAVINLPIVVARNNDPGNIEPKKRVMALAVVFPDGQMRIRKAFLSRIYANKPGFPFAAYEFTDQDFEDEIFRCFKEITDAQHRANMRRIEEMKKRGEI